MAREKEHLMRQTFNLFEFFEHENNIKKEKKSFASWFNEL